MEDYRPIVLGNFLYKIIAKILASRLGPIISSCASINRFGFIPNFHIHDCIAIASEGINLINSMKKKHNMALKVDIIKDFDTINWDFLLHVLHAFGFNNKFWISFILHSARLSILINGSPTGYFSCSQGVR